MIVISEAVAIPLFLVFKPAVAEPERAINEHQTVHTVVGRPGIKEDRFTFTVIRNMGMAKEDHVGLPASAFPLDRPVIVMHAELVSVGDHQADRTGLEKGDPLDINAAGHVDIAAHAHHGNTVRDLDMKEIIDAVAAMDHAIKGIFPG